MKRAYALIAATWLGLTVGAPAHANGLDFTLNNATGYDIKAVYVDPTSSDTWTDDVMGADILPDGGGVNIHFTGEADSCKWDLKVEWTEDYKPTVWSGLNLCNISEVTLKYNRNTDETTAYTK